MVHLFMTNETNKPIDNSQVEIIEYSDELAKDFYEINAQWISSMKCPMDFFNVCP